MSTTKTPKATPAAPHHTPEGRARIAAASAENAKTRTRVGGRFAKKDAPTKAETPAKPATVDHQALVQELGIAQTENPRLREALSLVSQHQRTIDQLRSERTKLKEELVEERTKLKAAEGEIGELKSAMRAGLLQSEEKWKQADATVEHLRKTIATLQTSEANLTTNLRIANEETARAEQSTRDWEQIANERQGRIEKLEARCLAAETHAANLVESNTRLCDDLSYAEQGRDLAVKERDDAIRHIEADDRANLLGTLGVAFIVGLVVWFVRGWLHA